MVNKYLEMKLRHQAEMDALPIHFAFGDEQFDRKLEELGLTRDNYQEHLVSVGWGGFMRKEDKHLLVETAARHKAERAAAIAEDLTGGGYIYDMFRYELANHEYTYTLDVEETLDALGYTWDDIAADPRFSHGLEKARTDLWNGYVESDD